MRLNTNTLKLVAIVAMTIDHIAWLTWPGLNPDPWAITLHFLGRFTAPIMWFFIAEGLYHSRDRWRYFWRLAAFALISHFAFSFAFGADPAAINGTSVMFPLAMSVFTAAEAKRDNRDVCVDKTLSPWYNEYIAVRRRSPCRRRAKLCPEPRTLRVGRPI